MTTSARQLLEEAGREWDQLLAEVLAIKQSLGAASIVESFAEAGVSIDDELGALIVEAPAAAPGAETAAAPRREPGLPKAAVAASVPPPRPGPTRLEEERREEPAREAAASRELEVAPAASATSRQTKAEDLYGKLSDLMILLREDLTLRKGEDGARTGKVHQEISREIAREVAGRIRDSILQSLPHAAAAIPAPGAPLPDEAPRGQVRIPIDDIASMIDQLHKR